MYNSIYYNFNSKDVVIFDDEKGKIEYNYKPYYYKPSDEETEWKTIYGNNVKKKFGYTSDRTNYEIDINPIQRILIDNYFKSDEVSKNTIAFFDIEVSTVGGYPVIEQGDKEIYSNVIYVDGLYHLFINYDGKIKFKRDDLQIHQFTDEEEMLNSYMDFVNEKNITILSTWNGDNFDLPYLVNRMKYLGMDYKELSPIGIVDEEDKHSDRQLIKLGCRSHLDYLQLYKKFSLNDRESFKLDFIGELELKMKKIDYYGNLDELYRNDIDRFCEYNLRDVEILVGLEKKLEYVNLAITLCHEAHIPYEWVYSQSKLIEGAILTYLKNNKLVSINKPEFKTGKKIEGAYVKEPNAGLYKFIIDLDYTSEYPNMIRTLNLSNETKIGKIKSWNKYIQDFYRRKNLESIIEFKYIDKLSREETIYNISLDRFIKKLKKENWTISATGVVSSTDSIGFLPMIITDWFDKRTYFKKIGNFIRQYTKKIEMNSLYGAIAMSSFRFYDRELAESITISSQKATKFAENYVNKYFKKDVVIAGDTDSLFICLDGIAKNKEEVRQYAIDIQKSVNKELKIFCKKMFNVSDNKYLSLKQELIGSVGFWSGKKKYAMRLIEKEGKECNEIEIKGLDTIKSSFPKSMKKILNEIIIDILDEKDKDEMDDKIFNFHREKDKVDILDLGVNTGVKNVDKYQDKRLRYKKGSPIHCKASLNYNMFLVRNKLDKKYKLIKSGDKVKYFYLKNNEYQFSEMALNNEELCKEAKEFIEKHIDRDKIVASALHKKIKVFYEDVLKWNFPDFTQNINNKYF